MKELLNRTLQAHSPQSVPKPRIRTPAVEQRIDFQPPQQRRSLAIELAQGLGRFVVLAETKLANGHVV
jgi:hypothetical protein